MAKVRLDSWKSIAEYLKRSPRTVQRWHGEFGLPVHHFGGGKGPVFCYADELDAWLSGFVHEAGEEGAAPDHGLAARKRKSEYLAAQAGALWELRSEANLSAIAALYRSAIDQNPLNAPAFIGLANAIVLSAMLGILRGSAAYPRASDALHRASLISAESSESRCAAAWLQLVHERKWKRALEGFDEVLDRQPQSSHALAGRALADVATGNLQSAARGLEEAWRRNTFASPSAPLLSWVHYLAGDYEDALENVQQSRSTGDESALSAAVEALALIQLRPVKIRPVEQIAAAHPRSLVLEGALGYAYAISDQTGKAKEMLHNLNRMKGDTLYPIALVLMGLDDRPQAISFLEASYAEGSLWSLGYRFDPLLKPLRDDPRFKARLRKLGAPA